MKKFVSSLIFILLSLSFYDSLYGQQSPPDTTDVVKISTTLIQVDVTVVDKKGNPVPDLKPEDFEILENGNRQEITNFSYISLSPGTVAPETSAKSNKKSLILPPPVKLRPEQVRRTFAVFIDDLRMSFANNFWVKEALRKFVNEQMEEGDLVAIIRASTGIRALQTFTSDKRLLLGAIDKLRWVGLVDSSEGYGIVIDPIGRPTTDPLIQNEIARQLSFTSGTYAALNYAIRGMRDLPGRKSLLLFSEGLFQSPEDLRKVVDTANRAAVSIYPLDPRGLEVKKYYPGHMDAQDFASPKYPDAVRESRSNMSVARLVFSDNTLRILAEETGGTTYIDQNDLTIGIRKVIEDHRGYYLIGYQPDPETFDPKKDKFNKLQVKVKRSGLKVRYRSGFFGITDEELRKASQTAEQQLGSALTSPFGSNEVKINLYATFYNEAQDKNFIRSFVHIDPKDLMIINKPDGSYEAKFDLVTLLVDTRGFTADHSADSHVLSFTEAQLAKARESGIIYNLTMPVKKPGAYQFRVALRDRITEKIGAASQFVEVPNLEKNKLTLSNLIVRNYSREEWQQVSTAGSGNSPGSVAMYSSASRQFKAGTMLTYSFIIYNARTDAVRAPQLLFRTRLFYQGKLVKEGAPAPVELANQSDLERISALNVVTLGTDLAPGDYALQVIVSDELAKNKNRVATQWIDFEITR